MKILIVPEIAARESSFVRAGEIQVVGYKEHLEDISRLLDAQDKILAYDEAKERDLFIAEFKLEGKIYCDENTKQWLPTSDTIKGFQMAERALGCWLGWSACAKSRARSAE